MQTAKPVPVPKPAYTPTTPVTQPFIGATQQRNLFDSPAPPLIPTAQTQKKTLVGGSY